MPRTPLGVTNARSDAVTVPKRLENVRLRVGRASAVLKVVSSERKDAMSELRSLAIGAVPDELVRGFAEGRRSLVVETTSDGMVTVIRIGNTGAAQNFRLGRVERHGEERDRSGPFIASQLTADGNRRQRRRCAIDYNQINRFACGGFDEEGDLRRDGCVEAGTGQETGLPRFDPPADQVAPDYFSLRHRVSSPSPGH